MRGVCDRHAKDLQHFTVTPIQPHVMLYNRNQAAGTYGRVNLYSDSVLGRMLVAGSSN